MSKKSEKKQNCDVLCPEDYWRALGETVGWMIEGRPSTGVYWYQVHDEGLAQHSHVFEVGDTAGSAPIVLSVIPVSERSYDVILSNPIAPGEWTTLTAYVENTDEVPGKPDEGTQVVIGFLPGDVDGNGASVPLDILALIDALNGVRVLPAAQTDINRDLVTSPSDILRLIDLLNGVRTSRRWLGESLPERP